MTMHAACYGRLGAPREIMTRSGKPMTVASLAVEVADARSDDTDREPLWLGVLAFGRLADELARHEGETLSVSGRIQRNRWTDSDGAQREQLHIVADSLVSARSVRPGGKKKSNEGRQGPCARSRTASRNRGRTCARGTGRRSRVLQRRHSVLVLAPHREKKAMTMFNVYWTFQVGPCEDHDDAFDVTETEIQHCLEADLDAVCRTIGNALDECSMFIMSCSEFRVERRSAEEIEAEIEALHRLSGLLEETGCQTLAELKDRAQREPELRAKAERFMAGDSVQ